MHQRFVVVDSLMAGAGRFHGSSLVMMAAVPRCLLLEDPDDLFNRRLTGLRRDIPGEHEGRGTEARGAVQASRSGPALLRQRNHAQQIGQHLVGLSRRKQPVREHRRSEDLYVIGDHIIAPVEAVHQHHDLPAEKAP